MVRHLQQRSDSGVVGIGGDPVEPVYRRVDHRLHLRLTVASLGLWAVLVWWWQPLYVRDRNQQARWDYLLSRARYEEIERNRRAMARRREAVYGRA